MKQNYIRIPLVLLFLTLSSCGVLNKQRTYQNISGEKIVELVEAQLVNDNYAIKNRTKYKNFEINAESPEIYKKKFLGTDTEKKELKINIREYDTTPTTVEVWVNIKINVRDSRGGEKIRDATIEERKAANEALINLDYLVRENGGN